MDEAAEHPATAEGEATQKDESKVEDSVDRIENIEEPSTSPDI